MLVHVTFKGKQQNIAESKKKNIMSTITNRILISYANKGQLVLHHNVNLKYLPVTANLILKGFLAHLS